MSTPIKKPASSAASTTSSTTVEKDPVKLVEKLETKTKAVNANNISRVANSQLVSGDDKLHPLLSLKTGRAIERFPETPNGISKLSGTSCAVRLAAAGNADISSLRAVTLVDAILNALEADRSGREQEKRERLRVQIGLKPNPA
ncbi:hypothetical protein MBLNU459_g1484t2 [Dothideomycetes sp. NU459]